MVHRSGVIAVLVALSATPLLAQEARFENLQVLRADVSRADLNRVMLDDLTGLGLPRRQNEGCLYCHVGNMEDAVDTWDFASDDKPAKQTARVMMRMVREINDRHLAGLAKRVAPRLRVTCQTCHAGRTDPRPLADVLWATYEQDGIEAAIARYGELRTRYFGGDAYDFRVGVLLGLVGRMASAGAHADALALAGANLESYPDSPVAHQSRMLLILDQLVIERGIGDALAEFQRLRASENGRYVSPALLDGLGWRLARRDRLDVALQVFERNLSVYPDQYVPMESLADGLWQSGDRERPIEMFEEWLERHPDHAMARRRLTNLRERVRR